MDIHRTFPVTAVALLLLSAALLPRTAGAASAVDSHASGGRIEYATGAFAQVKSFCHEHFQSKAFRNRCFKEIWRLLEEQQRAASQKNLEHGNDASGHN